MNQHDRRTILLQIADAHDLNPAKSGTLPGLEAARQAGYDEAIADRKALDSITSQADLDRANPAAAGERAATRDNERETARRDEANAHNAATRRSTK